MPVGSGLSAQVGLAEEVVTNEQQTITGTPSATFGLNFDGALTPISLTTTATAASIKAALEALPNIGTGNTTVTGGPLPGAVTVTFSGGPVKGRNVPLLAVQGSVTGLTFATPVPGTGYGDYVVPNRFLEFNGEGVQFDVQRIKSTALRAGNLVDRIDRWAPNKKQAAGDITWGDGIGTTGYGMLLKHMLGAVSIGATAIDGSTLTNAKVMTFTVADPQGLSLTIQSGTPSVLAVVQPFTYTGCKIVAWDLSQGLDGMIGLKTTIDAQLEDTVTQSLAAASFPASQAPFDYTEAKCTIAGAQFDIRTFDLSYNASLNTSRFFTRGNTLKKEPIGNAPKVITGSMEAEFVDLIAYQRYVNATAGTQVPITMTWTGPPLPAPDATQNYVLKVTLPQVRFDGTGPDVSGPDIVTQTLPFTALWDGTVSAVTVQYQTSDTAV